MKKKTVGFCTAGVLAIAACSAPANLPVHLLHARADGADCTGSTDTLYKSRGLLDLTGATGYLQVFGWENTLEPITTVVNGDTLADASRATFFARQAQMTYATKPNLGLPTATWNFAASIAAGGTSSVNSVGIELLPDAIGADLVQKIPPGTLTPVEVDVTVSVAGTVGGSPENTNSLTFPLSVVNSGIACRVYSNGLCGPGRDQLATCAPDGGP